MWQEPPAQDRQQRRDDLDDRIAHAVTGLAAAALAVLWPFGLTAAAALAAAHLTGMHPARLARAARGRVTLKWPRLLL